MARRLMIWLTEAEMSSLEALAEAQGLDGPPSLGTLLIAGALELEVPEKPKKRDAWLRQHLAEAKAERAATPKIDGDRVKGLLTAARRPMTTTEIRDGLQLKPSSTLIKSLEALEGVEQVEEPAGTTRGRGMPPKWWGLVGHDYTPEPKKAGKAKKSKGKKKAGKGKAKAGKAEAPES